MQGFEGPAVGKTLRPMTLTERTEFTEKGKKPRGRESEVRCQKVRSDPDIGCHIAKERIKL